MFRPHSQDGFSLMEVLMVLALVVMASHLLMPDWQQSFNSTAFARQQQGMLKLMTQARTWAMVNNKPLTLCGWSAICLDVSGAHATASSVGGISAATHNRIIRAFDDSNHDRLWQIHETVIAKLAIKNIHITFNRGDYVRFSASGSTSQAGSWQLCYIYQNTVATNQGAKLILNSTGNVRTQEVSCAV